MEPKRKTIRSFPNISRVTAASLTSYRRRERAELLARRAWRSRGSASNSGDPFVARAARCHVASQRAGSFGGHGAPDRCEPEVQCLEYDCLQGFHVRSTSGGCAPGTRYSPPESKTPVICGEWQYVGGTANGQSCLLEALGTAFGGSWQFMIHGQSIAGKSQCLLPFEKPTSSPTLGNPQVVVAETSAGAPFAVGHVPAWVTEMGAVTRQGAVSEPVIPRMFWGDRFFVLYLGPAADNCDGACFGPVTLKFDKGSTVGATITFAAPGTSTEPLPFTIAPRPVLRRSRSAPPSYGPLPANPAALGAIRSVGQGESQGIRRS